MFEKHRLLFDCRAFPRNPSEHHAGERPVAAWTTAAVNAPDRFSGGVEPRNRSAVAVENAGLSVNAQSSFGGVNVETFLPEVKGRLFN